MKAVLFAVMFAASASGASAGEHTFTMEQADKGFIWGCKYYRPACREE